MNLTKEDADGRRTQDGGGSGEEIESKGPNIVFEIAMGYGIRETYLTQRIVSPKYADGAQSYTWDHCD